MKTSLTLDGAGTNMDSALAHGHAENLLPLTLVVYDAGGKMVASKSEDGSGIMRFDIARGKAWGALGLGTSSLSNQKNNYFTEGPAGHWRLDCFYWVG